MGEPININDFDELITDFFHFMGRDKAPSRQKIRVWYYALKHLSYRQLKNAIDEIQNTTDFFPNNFPKAVKDITSRKTGGPITEVGAPYSFGECEDCEGVGIFEILVDYGEKNYYSELCFCSKCENWKRLFPNGLKCLKCSKAQLEFKKIPFRIYGRFQDSTDPYYEEFRPF